MTSLPSSSNLRLLSGSFCYRLVLSIVSAVVSRHTSLQLYSYFHSSIKSHIKKMGHMQMSMRNGVTPKLKLTLTLILSPDPNRYRRRCPDPNARSLGYRSLYITWQQHHNCRIVCEFSLRIVICILPKKIN